MTGLIVQFEREIIGHCKKKCPSSHPPQLSGIKWRWQFFFFLMKDKRFGLKPVMNTESAGSPFRGDNQVYKMLLTFQSERTGCCVFCFFPLRLPGGVIQVYLLSLTSYLLSTCTYSVPNLSSFRRHIMYFYIAFCLFSISIKQTALFSLRVLLNASAVKITLLWC